MKKKFMMNFWTFSIVIVLTQFFELNRVAALSFTFATTPHLHAQVLIKNSYPSIDMKMHIKKILNLDHHRNTTIDEYISKVFNVQNSNPSYVFRLPGSRELIYRRSDFREAIFPNITNVNKFNKTFDHLQTSASNQQALKFTKDDISEELKFEKYFLDKMKSLEDSDYDENLRKIVEENVRTERTFMSFIDDLNRDLEDEEFRTNQLKLQNAQQISKPSNNKFKDSDDWDALGLSGWSGSMKEVNDKHRTTIESPIKANKPPSFQGSRQPKKVNTKTALMHYDNISYLNPPAPPQKSKSKPFNYQQVHQNYNSEENLSDNPEFNNIPNQLSVLLHDEETLLNKTGRTPASKPRWPLTSPREAHGDNDVYLARANNPFGHSTKWKYKNNSTDGDQREGRTKRGVVHLYSMIKCATGCDPISYKGYGCYCGFLGSGRALDGIDRCCKMHDYCYTHSKCPMFLEYFVPYLWKCYRGKPLCAIDHGEWGGPNSCASRLCECDQALSRCLRRFHCPKKRAVCTSNPVRLLQNLIMVL